ncbi:histidine kinase [Halobacterium wangiae]|uniref:histidine kinase n=1 Tax=Halobacterium wangiae TaxID=2902623 RepID=UPI001E3A1CC0|nr:histidine kinase [Halobacterium wangiae]
MATKTAGATAVATNWPNWVRGVLAGVVGGIAFGVMMTVMMTPVIENAIPALYGLSGGTAGWVLHVGHSAVFGVVFAALATAGGIHDLGRTTLVGAVYGVVLWAVFAAVVMPVWLQAVGFGAAPAVPNVNPQSLVGHVVYGVVLGVVYAGVTE